jgi:hypothetical protein
MDMKRMAGVAALGALLALTTPAMATTWSLSDANSSAQFDDGGTVGQFTWVVDGTDQVYDQDFWYRVGSTGGESRVGTPPPRPPGRTTPTSMATPTRCTCSTPALGSPSR